MLNPLSTEEITNDVNVTVYSGRNGEFLLYEDAGDGYGYEQGQFLATRLIWGEGERKFSTQRYCGSTEPEKLYQIRTITVINKNGTVEEKGHDGADCGICERGKHGAGCVRVDWRHRGSG